MTSSLSEGELLTSRDYDHTVSVALESEVRRILDQEADTFFICEQCGHQHDNHVRNIDIYSMLEDALSSAKREDVDRSRDEQLSTAQARIAALEGALRQIARNELEVFDDDLQATVVVSMDAEEMAEVARAALARQRKVTP